MVPKCVSQRLGAVTLAAVMAFTALASHGQAPPPWTPGDRAAALRAVRAAGDFETRPDASIPDGELAMAVKLHAQVELGQRVRPGAVDRFWAIEPPRRDVAVELADARRDGRLAAWLAGLSPPAPAYGALQALAQRYEQIVARGGWSALPKGPVLRQGGQGAAVLALRKRLAAEGYPAAPLAAEDLFDADLRRSLVAFQRSHTLAETGALNLVTRAALDVPAQARLDQIEANLERWRWMPRSLPGDRLEVDVADQSAVLFADGAPVLQMRVIVGDPRHRTPMFISSLTGVVFDPPWNVPNDIAKAEILPKAAKDPGYLARNDFVMTDGRLQQLPGPKSALGDIKFDLSSPFGVYLHDTPARSLFARPFRALSHGCMRLEKPQALAERLLAPQGWTPEAIAAAMAAGHTQATPLRRTLPLYVLYWTVVAQPDGEPKFRPDVYGWDRKLTEALAGAAAPPATIAAAATDCAVVSR